MAIGMLIIKILAIAILSIIAILLLALIVPIRYEFFAHITQSVDCEIEVILLFGFIKIEVLKPKDKLIFKIYLLQICVLTKKNGNNPNDKITKKGMKKVKKKKEKRALSLGAIKKILIDIKEVINIVKPKLIKIEGVYGFYDPYITGLTSVVSSLVRNLDLFHNINLIPVFDEEALDIKTEITGEFSILSVLIKIISSIFKSNAIKPVFFN